MYYVYPTTTGDRIDFALADFGLGIAPVFMNPSVGETYFINPDPSRTQYTPYDSLSAGILYGLQSPSVNHYMGFDTNAGWVAQTNPKGKLLLKGQWVVTFGGRMPNPVVAHYELTAKSTPVYCAFESGQNEFMSRSTNAVVAALSPSLTEHEDYVVIERVWEYDNEDNILMIFGFTWKGTWAGGIYFKDNFWTHPYGFVGYSYVILHWVDNNMDGIPQADEISAVAAG